MEFLIGKVLERLLGFINEQQHDQTLSVPNTLKTLQRLYEITPSSSSIAVLLEAGYSSASAIAEIPKDVFVSSLQGRVLVGEARQIYDAAVALASLLRNVKARNK